MKAPARGREQPGQEPPADPAKPGQKVWALWCNWRGKHAWGEWHELGPFRWQMCRACLETRSYRTDVTRAGRQRPKTRRPNTRPSSRARARGGRVARKAKQRARTWWMRFLKDLLAPYREHQPRVAGRPPVGGTSPRSSAQPGRPSPVRERPDQPSLPTSGPRTYQRSRWDVERPGAGPMPL